MLQQQGVPLRLAEQLWIHFPPQYFLAGMQDFHKAIEFDITYKVYNTCHQVKYYLH